MTTSLLVRPEISAPPQIDVQSVSPLRTASLLWQLDPGVYVLTVVAKATFVLAPDLSPLADQQEEPTDEPLYWDDDPTRSLFAPSDLAPFKRMTDVLLVGFAYGPRGATTLSVKAELGVGAEVSKAIEAYGERVWTAQGLEALPLTRVSLRYERAAGGAGTTNPFGMSFEPRADGRIVVPPLQPVGAPLTHPNDRFAPVGFGPIGPSTLPPSDRPHPILRSVDPEFFNSAPPDQRMRPIDPNETLLLAGLHARYPRLTTRLPGVSPRVFAELGGRAAEEVRMVADTLLIDTARSVCSVVWRGQVALAEATTGRVLVGMERPGMKVSWAEVRDAAEGEPAASGDRNSSPTLEIEGSSLTFPVDAAPPWLERARAEAPARPSTPAPPAESPRQPSSVFPAAGPPSAFPPAPQAPAAVSLWAPPSAAQEGALAASNAAAAAPALDASMPPARAPSLSPRTPREVVELLAFEPASLSRIRLWWKDLLEETEFEPFDSRHELGTPGADGSGDRHDVFCVLTRGAVDDAAGLTRALASSVSEDGRFTPPLVLTGGELELQLDEVETLKATVGLVRPFAASDKRLKQLVDEVTELLKSPDLEGSSDISVKLTSQLREQFGQVQRSLSPLYVEVQTERRLLAQRHFQMRTVFGSSWIRALLKVPNADAPLPTYLPESLKKSLPMVKTLRTRMIAELGPQQDESETHAYSLRTVALGRVLRIDGLPSLVN